MADTIADTLADTLADSSAANTYIVGRKGEAMSTRPVKIAAVIALCVLIGMVVFLRMRNHIPLVAAMGTFVIAWLALLPARRPKGAATRSDEQQLAVDQLDHAAKRLERLARRAPAPDRPLFRRMAELMRQIQEHHRLNPSHASLTAKFRKHVVGRMVESVYNYVELATRSGQDQKDRLAAISTQLEEFVPVLEKIDQACLDNDLMALEINVEVLNVQLNRRR